MIAYIYMEREREINICADSKIRRIPTVYIVSWAKLASSFRLLQFSFLSVYINQYDQNITFIDSLIIIIIYILLNRKEITFSFILYNFFLFHLLREIL